MFQLLTATGGMLGAITALTADSAQAAGNAPDFLLVCFDYSLIET